MTTDATGAPAAPAAAPVAAPAPSGPLLLGDGAPAAPAPAAPAPADTGPAIIEYNATGDAGLDLALGFVGKLGFGPSDPAMVAATAGDFGMLKAKLAGLGDKAKGFEQYIALAEQAHKTSADKATEAGKQTSAVVEAAVGGPEQWSAIREWAGKNAEPAEKQAVNAALNAGGIAAKAMALYLSGLYEKAGGTTIEPSNPVRQGATGRADAGSGALSAADYGKAVQALRTQLGYAFDSSKQYEALQARRLAGQRQGL